MNRAPALSMAMLVLIGAGCLSRADPAPTSAPALETSSTALELSPSTTTGIKEGWVALARMIVPRSEVPAGVVGDLVYVPGGLTGRGGLSGTERTVEVYDPSSDSWQLAFDMPQARHHLMAAGYGGRLYVFGGYDAGTRNPTDTAWALDPASAQWEHLASMPFPVAAGAAVAAGDHLYVIGGVPDGTVLIRYDPAADTWEELAGLAEPREHVAAAELDGQIYVVGGRWRDAGERSTGEVLDLGTGKWASLPLLSTPRGGHAVAAYDGRILAIGGEVLASREALSSVETYDPDTGSWSSWPGLPVGLHGVPAAVVSGSLYVLGGSKAGAAILNDGTTYRWQEDSA